MSLRLQLPLTDGTATGSITQGIIDYDIASPVVSGSMSADAGKLGRYSAKSGSGYIDTGLFREDIAQNHTIMGWFKISDWGVSSAVWGNRNSSSGLMLYRNSGDTVGLLRAYYWYLNSAGTATVTSYSYIQGIEANEWFHAAISVTDQGVLKLYQNGDLRDTKVNSDFSSWMPPNGDRGLAFCGAGSGGYASSVVSGNDCRYYDHTCSDAEIKDASLALISKFDFNKQEFGGIAPVTGWSAYASYSTVVSMDKSHVTVSTLNTGTTAIQPLGFTLTGKNVRVSGYCRRNGKPVTITNLTTYATTGKFYNDPETGWFCMEELNATGVWLFHTTFGDNRAIGDTLEFYDLVVEQIAGTGTDTVLVDESGMGNTLPTTSLWPTFTRDNEGGPGTGAYHFNSSQLQSWEHNAVYFDPTTLTLNSWVKLDSYAPTQSPLFEGEVYQTIGSTGKIRCYWYDTSVPGYHVGNATVPLNEWCMITSVWTGTKLRFYLNGVFDAEFTTSTPGRTPMTPKAGYASEYRYLDGFIGEQKMFAKALSDEDIKRLYSTRASVSDTGVFKAHEIVEPKSNIALQDNIKAIADYNQYGNLWSTSSLGSLASSIDYSQWVESDGTLGAIYLTGWVYITSLDHTPSTFEYTRGNNDMGFYFYFQDKTDWVLGWNYCHLTRHAWDSTEATDWSNMNRLEIYGTNLTDPDLPGTDYIIFRDIAIHKLPSGKTAGSVDNGGTLRGEINEIGYKPSVCDYSSWVIGGSTDAYWTRNGSSTENIVNYEVTPWGNMDVMWSSRDNDTASSADGGYNSIGWPINPNYTYRFSQWIRREVTGNGSWYLGCYGLTGATNEGIRNIADGSINTNPYFKSSNSVFDNEWFLVVGYVYATGTTTDLNADISGIYGVDGTKLETCTNYKWSATADNAKIRSYLYYSTLAETVQHFYRPRMDLVNGGEPTLQDLLSGGDNPNIIHEYGNGSFNNSNARFQSDGNVMATGFIEG